MIAAGSLAAGLLALALPVGEARYRVELGGVPVGTAALRVECASAGAPCRLSWESRLRLPAAAGGALRTRRIEAEVDGQGRLRGRARVEVDGARRPARARAGAVLLEAAELVLSAPGAKGCVPVTEPEGGGTGKACAARRGGILRAEVLGVAEEVTAGADGFPEAVALPAQRTRFVKDPAAQVPEEAPPLEVRVPGPPRGRPPRAFCGLAVDPPSLAPGPRSATAGLPAPRPDGRSCQDQAQAYAAELRRLGFQARIALGVAHDGDGFVWHAWVEGRARPGAPWTAVDPAFGELPARGPRFTVARHGGDPAGLDRAGRRILACWGRAAVE